MKKTVGLLLVVVIGALWALAWREQTAVAETAVPDADTWSSPKVISTGITNAKRPVIKADPNTPGKVMVVFISQQINNTPIDPYYTLSTNYGVNWTTPSPIHQSGVESKQIDFDFDNQGTAHAVWRENRSLAYANSSNWAGSFKTLSAPTGDPGVTTPSIGTFGSNIHVVWSEANTGDPNPIKTVPNIYYSRSTNRGANWLATPVAITSTGLDSVSPSIAVDAAGNVHVVWQELEFDQTLLDFVFKVKYVKGTVSANSVSWSAPLTISNAIVASPFDAHEPHILATNSGLEVTLTTIFQQPVEQYVYLLSCRSSCESLSKWTNQGNVSGPALYVNVEPVDLASSPTNRLGCTHVFFDGATTDNPEGKEQVWMANGCRGWNAPRTPITDNLTRALRPSSDSLDNWLYLAYEEAIVIETGNTNKIYFLSNESDYGMYLPVVIKR
ncbi:MAG: hypothetical protein H6659_14465 [Ardenticatenaceae bacterium]|nr:hypothetical protein [Ardenticatenaceae bacterium]MCB8986803.1 hypothetical protein [Ardenticatenaceae bacterium]